MVSRDDPVFEAILIDLLKPYIEAARKWWAEVEHKTFENTTTYPVKDGPPGMFEKCVRSPRQSPVYGIQAFPLVSLSYLNYPPGMKSGAIHLTDHICKHKPNGGLEIEEFICFCKFGYNSSHMNGFYLVLVPKERLGPLPHPRWVYMRPSEIVELASGIVTPTLIERMQPFAEEYHGDIPGRHR